MAIRIQQAWQRYVAAKKAALAENTSLSGMDSLDDSSVLTADHKARNIGGRGVDLNPLHAISNMVDGVKNFLKEKEVRTVSMVCV